MTLREATKGLVDDICDEAENTEEALTTLLCAICAALQISENSTDTTAETYLVNRGFHGREILNTLKYTEE